MRLDCRISPSCGSNSLRGLSAAWGFYTRSAPPSRVPAGTGLANQGCNAVTERNGRSYTYRSNCINPGTISPNVCALRPSSLCARREPGGAIIPGPVRFANSVKRPLDFHGEPQLSESFAYETQPLTELSAGSRICRHRVLRLNAPSPWRSTWS